MCDLWERTCIIVSRTAAPIAQAHGLYIGLLHLVGIWGEGKPDLKDCDAVLDHLICSFLKVVSPCRLFDYYEEMLG